MDILSLRYHGLSPASGHQLCALPFLCPRVPVSPGGELLHVSGALVFVAVTQGISLDHLTLDPRGNFDPGFHGTRIIREAVLGRLPPQGTA